MSLTKQTNVRLVSGKQKLVSGE